MSTPTEIDPRYPIGKFTTPTTITADDRSAAIAALTAAPEHLRNAVDGLSQHQLETPYRDGGWTVRQTVHHVADSHLNAFSRFKLALTEDWPTIYAYKEAEWAKLADNNAPAEISLNLVESVHTRWVMLLKSMNDEQWRRGIKHPERGNMPLERAVMLYAWHSRHHTAHITRLRESKGW